MTRRRRIMRYSLVSLAILALAGLVGLVGTYLYIVPSLPSVAVLKDRTFAASYCAFLDRRRGL